MKVRSQFAHFGKELKIIKITCDQKKNNCTEQTFRPPADNLILLRVKKKVGFSLPRESQNFPNFLCSPKTKLKFLLQDIKKPEENPTHKKIV